MPKQPPSVISFNLDFVAIHVARVDVSPSETMDCIILDVDGIDEKPYFMWGLTRPAAAELLPYLQEFLEEGKP